MRGPEHEDLIELLNGIKRELSKLSKTVHEARINEYVDLMEDPKRLLVMNFLLGLVRGLGMAIGFTILGAFVFYILKQIIVLNLPVISDFISDLVRLVQQQSP